MQDNFLLEKGKEDVIKGIRKAASIIKETYGAAGGNVIVEDQLYPYHRVTNDGKLIVDSLQFSDPYEKLGLNIMKEAGDNAERDSGDGRKTTMLLTDAIFTESQGIKELPVTIYRSLKECIPGIFERIDAQKKEITVDDVKAVATVSSESEEIGQVVEDIYKEIGKEGIIEVESSNLPETFYEVTEGVRLRNAGFFGRYALTEEDKAVYKDPAILIVKDKIVSSDQLDPLFTQMRMQGKSEIVIYFDEIDLPVAARLAATHMKGVFRVLLIKAPKLWKDWLFEDFAKITGASVIDSKEGITFKDLTMKHLGHCDKLIAMEHETRVIGGKGDIAAHIEYLNGLNTEEAKLRSSWLQTKAAILKVGANSETEWSYRLKKAKDACNASYLALKDGVVAGGGLALLNVSTDLSDDTIGNRIMKKVLQYPFIQNLRNYGLTDDEIKQAFADGKFTPTQGMDVRTGEYVNLMESGIIDPALVVKNAVKNAISLASTSLTAKGATIIPKKDQYANTSNMPGM